MIGPEAGQDALERRTLGGRGREREGVERPVPRCAGEGSAPPQVADGSLRVGDPEEALQRRPVGSDDPGSRDESGRGLDVGDA